MEITQVTTIELEETEITALETLKKAYEQCIVEDCFSCEICPLYVSKVCIGKYAETALNRPKERDKKL